MIIDPADVDWTQVDDGEVWLSAKFGILEAAYEFRRRGLVSPQPAATPHTGPGRAEDR